MKKEADTDMHLNSDGTQPNAMPSGSSLYCLEPLGTGTDNTESLTSYISRIAEANNMQPGKLLASIIIPKTDKGYMISKPSSHSENSYNCSLRSSSKMLNIINGINNITIEIVNAMGPLVMRDDLELLTMLPWSNVITSRNLLRNLAAWCPFCFQEWKSNGYTIYSPLIWTLNIVKICKFHNTYLHNKCPKCKQTMQMLSSSTRVGYCSKCGEWLGLPFDKEDNTSPQNIDWELWVYDNIGELIASTQYLKVRPHKDIISKNLKAINKRTGYLKLIDMSRLSMLINEKKSTMSNWYNGKTTPAIEPLLKICYCLDFKLLSFLTEEMSAHSVPVNQRDLRYLFSKPKKLANKPMALRIIENKLNIVISSNEYPPPSLAEISRRVRASDKYLKKHFPELCSLIMDNYKKFIKDYEVEKIHKLCQEVREASIELHRKGIYPSRRKVEELCSIKGINLYQDVYDEWKKTKRELGYD